jgi:murein L,D-transpeptidase YafK
MMRFYLAFLMCVWLIVAGAWPASAEKVYKVQAVDRVEIVKSKKMMTLYQGQRVVKMYPVSLGKAYGKKEREGDNKTPEGIYYIVGRNPQSKFYKSLWISYPNEVDLQHAATLGVKAGGNIMIHGVPTTAEEMAKYQAYGNWTNGCIAVTNEQMDEVWNLVEDDTVVEILP